MSSAELESGSGSFRPALSQRDWFAGLAMQGMVGLDRNGNPSEMALRAFDIADAMLAESKKRSAN